MTDYVDSIDWSLEDREQKHKLDDGSNFLKSERLPAKIVLKIKIDKKNVDQTNKRTLPGISEKRT